MPRNTIRRVTMPEEMQHPAAPRTLAAAILETTPLLEKERASAEERALAILAKAPGQPEALALLIAARRIANDLPGACALLGEMADANPKLSGLQFELGRLQYELADTNGAIEALSRAVGSEPQHAEAWRVLGDSFAKAGQPGAATGAYAKFFALSVPHLERLETEARSGPGQLPAAEASLRQWLQRHPTDVFALQLLGTICLRLARHEDAEQFLSRALDIAPQQTDARFKLAGTFVYRGDWPKALEAAEKLLEADPNNPDYLDLKSFALLRLGEFQRAADSYKALVAGYPSADNWKSYGHALKALGRTDEAIAAYRRALAEKSTYGMAYWSLAELKTFQFETSDIDAMGLVLEKPDLSARDRALVLFSIGKALEDSHQYETAFGAYNGANETMRTFVRHAPEQRSNFVQRSKTILTPEFFAQRFGWGTPRTGPIFIVGLPRSGSTLIEQILASHSQIEPTSELQVLESVIRDLSMGEQRKGRRYPELMQDLSAEQVRQAGEDYFERAAVYRKLNRPFFIDKMPNNFSYLGMILTALPNAKIIDVRRHPLGTGLAIFKHYFVEAYSFAFDLGDIGRYYRDYVELMAHLDAVQPGRVHRVFYEKLVADPEREIRKLLDYCGLPFEEPCLRFHENTRPVLTPSAEQVRRPIYAEATDLWRKYERWLGPLKAALGDVVERYPDVPDFPKSLPLMKWGISQPLRWGTPATPIAQP